MIDKPIKGPEADRLMTAEEVERLKPNRDIATDNIFFEGADGERVFVPRLVFVQIFHRYADIVAGLAATR